MRHTLIVLALLCSVALPSFAGDAPAFTRTEDVVYGRKFGVALTLDVFKPKENANGIGIIYIVSGGWVSSHDSIGAGGMFPYLRKGYTVFAVVHGCQPKFTIPEITQDLNRAVRFIRFHAADYGVDPDALGITGGSAGGHLSLMQGTAGDAGDPKAKDPIDRVSSRVQAVACFYPPTDFLNYGKEGEAGYGRGLLKDLAAPFDFKELDPKTHTFAAVTDEEKIKALARQISPIYHVAADSPPTLIFHGDKDTRVPLQQSQTFIEKMKAAGVDAKLVIKEGAGHGWPNQGVEAAQCAEWFDAHLKKK
jgi:acetyl esterase/lipase